MNIPSHEHTDVFRDPIHGLIKVYPWEKRLIDSPEFQRLKRIHQLSMTNLVYHGAEHTRFGHSIGVMHVAGRIMDHLRNVEPLSSLTEDEFLQKKAMVRMAGLLHDLGHGCYSHIGEGNRIYPDLIDPLNGESASGHEAYTRCIIKERMSGIINEAWNDSEHHMVPHILMILNQSSDDPRFRFFDDIISGQLDCDKMDYLLRDSHYCGVEYGTYDLDKLIDSLTVVSIHDNMVLAIRQNGIQTVEGFVLARYWMFIQVYFHKYRRLFDYYLSSFIKELFLLEYEKSGQYPKNLEDYQRLNYVKRRLDEYLEINDQSTDDDKHQKHKVYVDLATGSATKYFFDIKVYNEEQDPDCFSIKRDIEIPAIPVLSKHNGEPEAIQKYSFTIKSISDKKISILRIYAEEDMIDIIQSKCENWFTVDYDTLTEEYKKMLDQKKQKQRELEQMENRLLEITNTLGMDACNEKSENKI